MLRLPKLVSLVIIFSLLLFFSKLLLTNFSGRLVTDKLKLGVPTSSPTGVLVSDERVREIKETITPWGHSDNILESKPAGPSPQELLTIYSLMKKAVEKRDATALSKLVAKERMWYFENPKRLLGEASGGRKVFARLKVNPPENNFPELLYLAPGAAEVDFIKVTEKPEPELLAKFDGFLLVDEEKNETVFVSQMPWRYAVEAEVKTKPDTLKKGEGKVTFVYDQGIWKYYGEIWDFELKDKSESFGDSPSEAKGRAVETTSNEKKFPPRIIKIKVGEGIVWRNIYGIIYTFRTELTHWNSPFLQKDDFLKVFREKGSYFYKIISENTTFMGEIDVE